MTKRALKSLNFKELAKIIKEVEKELQIQEQNIGDLPTDGDGGSLPSSAFRGGAGAPNVTVKKPTKNITQSTKAKEEPKEDPEEESPEAGNDSVDINEPSGWDAFVNTTKALAVGIVRDGSRQIFADGDTTWTGVTEVTIENSEPDSTTQRKKELFYSNALIKSFYAAFNEVDYSKFKCDNVRDEETGKLVENCDLWGSQRVGIYSINTQILSLIKSPHAIKAFLRGGPNALKGKINRIYTNKSSSSMPPSRFFDKKYIDKMRNEIDEQTNITGVGFDLSGNSNSKVNQAKMRNMTNHPVYKMAKARRDFENNPEATEKNYIKLYKWFKASCKTIFADGARGLGPDRMISGTIEFLRSGLPNELVEDYLIISQEQFKEILPWAVKNQIHPELFMICCLRIFYMLQTYDYFSGKSKLNEQDDTDYSNSTEDDSALRDEMGVDWNYANRASRKTAKVMRRKRVIPRARRENGLRFKHVFADASSHPVDSAMGSLVDFAVKENENWLNSPQRMETTEVSDEVFEEFHGMNALSYAPEKDSGGERSMYLNATYFDIERIIENQIKKAFQQKVKSNTQLHDDFSLFNQLLIMAPHGDFNSEDLKTINNKMQQLRLDASGKEGDKTGWEMTGEIGAFVLMSLPEGLALDALLYRLRDGARAVMGMKKKPPGKLFIITWIAAQVVIGLMDPVNKADLTNMKQMIDNLMKHIASLSIAKNNNKKQEYEQKIKSRVMEKPNQETDTIELDAGFDEFLKSSAFKATEEDAKSPSNENTPQNEQNTKAYELNGQLFLTHGPIPSRATDLSAPEDALQDCPKRFENPQMQLVWCRWRQWRLSFIRAAAERTQNYVLAGLNKNSSPTPFLEDKMYREFKSEYRSNPGEMNTFFSMSKKEKEYKKQSEKMEFEQCPYVPKGKRLTLTKPNSDDPFVWSFSKEEMTEVDNRFQSALGQLQAEFIQSLESTFVNLADKGKTAATEIEKRLQMANSIMQLLTYTKTAMGQIGRNDARITNLNYCDTLSSLEQCKTIAEDIFNQVKTPDTSFILQGGELRKIFKNDKGKNESMITNQKTILHESGSTEKTKVAPNDFGARMEHFAQMQVASTGHSLQSLPARAPGSSTPGSMISAIYRTFIVNEFNQGVVGTNAQVTPNMFKSKLVQFSKQLSNTDMKEIVITEDSKDKLINDWKKAFQRLASEEGLYEKFGKNFAKGSMFMEFKSGGKATFSILFLCRPYGQDLVFRPTGMYGTSVYRLAGRYDIGSLGRLIEQNFIQAYGGDSGGIIDMEELSSVTNNRFVKPNMRNRMNAVAKKAGIRGGIWSDMTTGSSPVKSGANSARPMLSNGWAGSMPNSVYNYMKSLRTPTAGTSGQPGPIENIIGADPEERAEWFNILKKDLETIENTLVGAAAASGAQHTVDVKQDMLIVEALKNYIEYLFNLTTLRNNLRSSGSQLQGIHKSQGKKSGIFNIDGPAKASMLSKGGTGPHLLSFNRQFSEILNDLRIKNSNATDKDAVAYIARRLDNLRNKIWNKEMSSGVATDERALENFAFEFYRSSHIAINFANISAVINRK